MIRMQMGGKRVVGRPTQLIYISDIYLLFVDDQHRNTNMNDKDHLVGQLTSKMTDQNRRLVIPVARNFLVIFLLKHLSLGEI